MFPLGPRKSEFCPASNMHQRRSKGVLCTAAPSWTSSHCNENEKIGEPGFGPMWYPKIQLSPKGRFMALSFPHRSKLGLEIRVELTNIGDNYVHTHSRSHPPCFTGKSSRNGSFSMAMPQYQRVSTNKPIITSKGEMRRTKYMPFCTHKWSKFHEQMRQIKN